MKAINNQCRSSIYPVHIATVLKAKYQVNRSLTSLPSQPRTEILHELGRGTAFPWTLGTFLKENYLCHLLWGFVVFKWFSHISYLIFTTIWKEKAIQLKEVGTEAQGSCHLPTFTQPTSGSPRTSCLMPSHSSPHQEVQGKQNTHWLLT